MILALTLALAAPDVPINCDNPGPQVEHNECAARAFRDADAELNRRWPEWMAQALAADGTYDGSATEPDYQQVLREAQRRWVAFRDAHCAYDARFQARGGTLESLIYEDCREDMTRERIRQLDAGNQTLSER